MSPTCLFENIWNFVCSGHVFLCHETNCYEAEPLNNIVVKFVWERNLQDMLIHLFFYLLFIS